MTDGERDPQLSARYRDLGREEPPRELDEHVLAAARRAASPRRRWAVPVAAAAAVTLAVAVALQVEEDAPAPAPGGGPAAVHAPAAPPAEVLRSHPGAAQRDAVTGVQAPRSERKPLAAPTRQARDLEARSASEEVMGAGTQREPAAPQEMVARIVELRAQDRHEEADRALAELRRRYPGHPVPREAERR